MKRCFLLILTGYLILFCGCTSNVTVESKTAGMDESERLNWIFDQMDNAGSIEWNQISQKSYQQEQEKKVDRTYSHSKYIREPFTQWSRSEMSIGDAQPFVIEIFDEAKNGTLVHSMRSSDREKETKPLTAWSTVSLTDEEKETYQDIVFNELKPFTRPES